MEVGGEVKAAHSQLALFGEGSYFERGQGAITSSYLRNAQGPGTLGFNVPAGSGGDISFSDIKPEEFPFNLQRIFTKDLPCARHPMGTGDTAVSKTNTTLNIT